jgi:hypothetical protein
MPKKSRKRYVPKKQGKKSHKGAEAKRVTEDKREQKLPPAEEKKHRYSEAMIARMQEIGSNLARAKAETRARKRQKAAERKQLSTRKKEESARKKLVARGRIGANKAIRQARKILSEKKKQARRTLHGKVKVIAHLKRIAKQQRKECLTQVDNDLATAIRNIGK